MQAQELIAQAVQASKQITARYLAGFDDSNRTRQAPSLPNHAAWCLGHCALTMHRVAEKLDAGPIPETDFIPAGPMGDRERFGTESVAFASTPADDPAGYPPLARCVQIYNAACDRLSAAARGASDAKLQEPIKWGPVEAPLGILALRMLFHNGMHTGQIADLRRALGMKSIMT